MLANLILPAGAAGIVLILLAAWVVWTFNRLVRDRNLVEEGWSGIDVQLKRRLSLVPNLVETVKGYGRHEARLLERIASLRGGADDDAGLKDTETRENALTDQLRQLLALAEGYPEIRADASYRRLQEQLAEIEDQVQLSRRYYNGAVRNYNIRVESFPGNLVAGALRFERAEYFQVEAATARVAPTVEIE